MATRFPSNFTDSFTRADNANGLGAPWYGPGGGQNLTLVSNQAKVVGTTGFAFASLNGLNYGEATSFDIAIQVQVGTVTGTSNDQVYLYLRSDLTQNKYYKVKWVNAGTITIETLQGIIATTVFRAPITGDVLKFQATGDVLTAFVNGSQVLSVVNVSVNRGDIIGFGGNGTNNTLDNFAIVPSLIVDTQDGTNTKAEYNTVNNELICDRTGFRIPVADGLKREWTGLMVRKESWESRHPQDFVRGVPEHPKGSPRPQQQDIFLNPGDVTPNSY